MQNCSNKDGSAVTLQLATSVEPVSPIFQKKWGSRLLFLALLYAAVGSSPFSRPEVFDNAGGDAANQIIWGLFAVIGMAVAFYDAPRARMLLRRSWPIFLVVGWIILTSQWAPYPDLTYRRAGFLFVTTVGLFGLVLASPDPARFFRTLLLISGLVMMVNVAGLVLAPGLSIGPDGAAKGLFPHKNTAGQFALVAFLIWLVAALVNRDLRRRVVFLLGALAWFGFLILTQSKTSIGIAVVAPVAMVIALQILHAEGLVRVAMITLLIGLIGAGWYWLLGAGISTEDVALLTFGDLTFTGRTDLWEYLWREVANNPVKGFGYGSFWHTGLRSSPINFADGWVANAGQAHNGYLDLIVQTGFIGLALAVIVILRSMALVIMLVGRQGLSIEERSAYVLCLVLLGAILLLNFMESSYFRNGHYLSVLFTLIYFMIESWSQRPANEPTGLPTPAA